MPAPQKFSNSFPKTVNTRAARDPAVQEVEYPAVLVSIGISIFILLTSALPTNSETRTFQFFWMCLPTSNHLRRGPSVSQRSTSFVAKDMHLGSGREIPHWNCSLCLLIWHERYSREVPTESAQTKQVLVAFSSRRRAASWDTSQSSQMSPRESTLPHYRSVVDFLKWNKCWKHFHERLRFHRAEVQVHMVS